MSRTCAVTAVSRRPGAQDQATVEAARPSPRGAPSVQQGQATVELALLLPLLMVMALFLVQVGLVVRDQIMVAHSAREAARAVAVANDAAPARSAALAAARLDPDRVRVHVDGPAGTGHVTVRVEYRSPIRFAVLGAVLGDLTLSTEATMRAEG